MRYLSTRGHPDRPSFEDVLLGGLAPDGGLYLPVSWPRLHFAGNQKYIDLVAAGLTPFVTPDHLESDLKSLAESAYAGFRHEAVAPVQEIGEDRFLLELFWGPTLSFKDYALAMVGRMFDRVLSRTDRRLMVLGATSGDTGSAAISACRGREHLDVVILYPAGRVSDVQRRQMTTVTDANVAAVAVEGTFDDCQALVKQAFNDRGHGLPLGAVNSINWARVIAQAAYYLWAAAKTGADRVSFAVPTGNFGNAFAGWVAKRAGGPIGRLLIANNANHGLFDLIEKGVLRIEPVVATHSPAMDIQIPSNLERYLYELTGGDPREVRRFQETLRRERRMELPTELRERVGEDFAAGWVDDDAVVRSIATAYREHGVVLDPHTAVAWEVGNALRREGEVVVTIATAHPAKFPDLVREAVGIEPELPADLADIHHRPERITTIPNDYAALVRVLVGMSERVR
ncbi:MAG: threonine synthase [Acidimicrobiia bacterium]